MLASKNRFHRRNHVNRVYKQGKNVRSPHISLKYIIDARGSKKRFAVAVSKKVSKKAVVRNRIRRRIFACIEHELQTVPDGFDGVFSVFEETIETMPSKELQSIIRKLLTQAK